MYIFIQRPEFTEPTRAREITWSPAGAKGTAACCPRMSSEWTAGCT